MKNIKYIIMIAIISFFITGCSRYTKDDWVLDLKEEVKKSQNHMTKSSSYMMATNSAPLMRTKTTFNSIGFSVGGAKDSNNFYDNINNGYLPKIDSLTYEGIFYKYYFDTGKQEECKDLFCPSYTKAITKDIFLKDDRYYLSVGLNSGIKEFKRKPLNLVVVLDISGSMGSQFNKYYYDRSTKIENEHNNTSKMQIANQAIVDMISHLKQNDKLAIVLFDNEAYLAKPLNKIADTDIEAIKKHILKIKEKGGTNWSAGYKKGLELFNTLSNKERVLSEYENRIVFLTDAMPNMGELNKDGLFHMSKKASNQNIFTTFVGIGVDFNTNLVEYVNKTAGGNYFSIHSNKEFKKRLNEEFDFWVSPLVFDLSLSLKSKDYKITGVYGNPTADKENGELIKIHSLFPSHNINNSVKGGVILVELEKVGNKNPNIELQVSYRDRENNLNLNKKNIVFNETKEFFENTGIKKAIALKNFVALTRAWIAQERKICLDKVDYFVKPYPLKRGCIDLDPLIFPLSDIKTWEKKSCKLNVEKSYKTLFSIFQKYFENEMKELKDNTLNEELEVIKKL